MEAPAPKKGDMAFARNMPANLSKYDFSQSGSLTSMLILKQGKQYVAYAMTIMGDSSYIKGDYSKLANNTYRKKDKDFTGWVLYHQLNGTFVNGWRYVNGQVTSAAHYNPGTAPSTQAVQSVSSPKVNVLQTCDITIVWHIFSLCSYAISDVTLSHPQDCTYIARFAGAYSTCSDVPVNNPGGDPSAPPPTLPPCVPQGGGSTAPAAVNGKTTLALQANKQTILVAQPTDPPPTDPNGEIVPVLLCPVDITTVDTIKVDSCAGKATAATTANNIVNADPSVSSSISAAVANGNNGVESAFHIDKIGSNTTSSTPVATTTQGAAYSSTNHDANTIAIGHNHTLGSTPQPSASDIFALGALNASPGGSNLATSYVVSPTTKYAVAVTNPTANINFNSTYGDSYLAKDANGQYTGDFNTSNTIGKDVVNNVEVTAISAYYSANGIDPANSTPAQDAAAESAGFEVALTYFVGNYPTGMTLLKADASGVFHPLHFTSSISSTGVKYYSATPCN